MTTRPALSYYAWLWNGHGAWAVVWCWKAQASDRSQRVETGITFKTLPDVERYVAQSNGCNVEER